MDHPVFYKHPTGRLRLSPESSQLLKSVYMLDWDKGEELFWEWRGVLFTRLTKEGLPWTQNDLSAMVIELATHRVALGTEQ